MKPRDLIADPAAQRRRTTRKATTTATRAAIHTTTQIHSGPPSHYSFAS
jgi:hypothetical protein